jgi:hypothetical protein
MAGPTDLYDLCSEYLDLCADAVATTPGGTIARQFVSPGAPAWDCPPQLSVHAGGAYQAETEPFRPVLQPGFRSEVPGHVPLVVLTATVLRCTPVVREDGTAPSVAALDASAAETLADLWAIWHTLHARHRAGTVFLSPLGQQRAMLVDPAVSLLTQGGAAGWQIGVRVALDGYPETT